MQRGKPLYGHLGAILSVLIWGTTFVSTKVLLRSFSPVEILLIRTVIGTLVLFAVRPKRLRLKDTKHNWYFAGAGLTGIALYYLMENIALTYTTASNVGVIVSVAPLFTALLVWLVYKTEKLRFTFFLGFVAALGGIAVISFAGGDVSVNPIGDLLALLAAVCWAFYSLLVRKIGSLGYDNLLATRRVFLYGLLFLAPASLLLGFSPDVSLLLQPAHIANFLYLGLCASALCFVTWNFAVRSLGPVKCSVYIYAVPVVTVFSSAVVLGEKVTIAIFAGCLLTLVGLAVSEWRPGTLRKKQAGQ